VYRKDRCYEGTIYCQIHADRYELHQYLRATLSHRSSLSLLLSTLISCWTFRWASSICSPWH
jgi:hypothetical protein